MRDGDRERGQSELVGFVLVFGVVTLTIGLVGVSGFLGLESAQDFQRTTNAEQSFTGLANNVEDVVRTGAPSRATEVRIADGRLSMERTETIEVTSDDGTLNETFESRPIVYDSGSETTLTYRNGAIVRQDGDSAVMIGDPSFVINQSVTILPLVALERGHDGPVGGSTAVDVRTRAAGADVVAVNESVGTETVTLNLTTVHADVWAQHFQEQYDVEVDVSGDSVIVTIDTERVYVTIHRVEVEFQ